MLKKIILLITILSFPFLYGFQKINDTFEKEIKINAIKSELKDYNIKIINNPKKNNKRNLFILDCKNEIIPYSGQLVKKGEIIFKATTKKSQEDITFYKDKSKTRIQDTKAHLEENYKGKFKLVKSLEIKDSKISSDNINEMADTNPTENEMKQICDDIFGKDNREYPGCGVWALLGIIDHFATNMGFFNFYNNELIMQDRKKMAKEVVRSTPTTRYSATKIQTLSSEFVSSFNKLVKQFNYNDFLDYNRGNIFQDRHKMIIDSLKEGMPVSVWTFQTCAPYHDHWFNIYGYELWLNEDNNKEYIMFKIRANWGEEKNFADAQRLHGIWGAVYYSFKKEKIKNFSSQDFKLGHFYNKYEINNKEILNKQKDLLSISYLNTGYIKPYYEKKIRFLTMNAGKNGNIAYFEFKTSFKIDKIRIFYSLWSKYEELGNDANDYISLFTIHDNTYVNIKQISLKEISKERGKWSFLDIDLSSYDTSVFRIKIYKSKLTQDNCGRFIFDNLIFYA